MARKPGPKTDTAAPLERTTLTLDSVTRRRLRVLGDGNESAGARVAARVAFDRYQRADTGRRQVVQTMWVVGQLRGAGPVWDLQGVFDNELAAEEACQDATYFIGPVPLNAALPHDATAWPGCRYPLVGVAA